MAIQKANPNQPYDPTNPLGNTPANYTPTDDENINSSSFVPQIALNISTVYTQATLPAASTAPHTIVYVTDAAVGQRVQWSDGTKWNPFLF